jgi:hypothetical protein
MFARIRSRRGDKAGVSEGSLSAGFMQEIEISLPPHVTCDEVAQTIDDLLSSRGLRVTLRDSLKKYPGCTHWHAKNRREPGTLEVTLWPQKRRAWFTVHSGRRAPWIEGELGLISADLEQWLHDI